MSEIPADVLQAAVKICTKYDPSDTAVCMAIMAERERCAQLVEAFKYMTSDDRADLAATIRGAKP